MNLQIFKKNRNNQNTLIYKTRKKPISTRAGMSIGGGYSLRHLPMLICTTLTTAATLSVSGSLNPALAEGSYQLEYREELNGLPSNPDYSQGLFEYNSSYSSSAAQIPIRKRPLYVDVLQNGEVINISACGVSDTDDLQVQLYYHPPGTFNEYTDSAPLGTQVVDTGTVSQGNITCDDPLNSPIDRNNLLVQYDTSTANGGQGTGTYEVRFYNISRSGSTGTIDRFDVTITPDTNTDPDPRLNQGRLWAYIWGFRSGGYDSNRAADTNYYIPVPSGYPGSNFIWQLDLNNFSGFAYEIMANQLGVESPNAADLAVAGLSVNMSGNNLIPKFKQYLSYPEDIDPVPGIALTPQITNFRFEDDVVQDANFTPGTTPGVQDIGFFKFDVDVNSTYLLIVDTSGAPGGGPDGSYGTGDVILLGTAQVGSNTVEWDGKDNLGNTLPNGQYTAQLEIHLGEYHFVAADAETSGGGAQNGLTIYQALPGGGTADTLVLWDDITGLPSGSGGTSIFPQGALSSSTAARHTWGSFARDSFGNLRYIDTYTYGGRAVAVAPAFIGNSDEPSDVDVSITKTDSIDPINIVSSNPDDHLLTYTLTVTNTGGETANVVTVNDPLPSSVTFKSASNPNCSEASGTVICNLGDIPGNGSNISVDIAVSVEPTAGTITNTATVSAGNEPIANKDNNSATEDTIITATVSNPDVLLVKRITAINGDRAKNPNDNKPLNTFVDDTLSTRKDDDNHPNWKSNYLLGELNAGKIKPGDEIEYTIYFLNGGNADGSNVRVCDRINPNVDFKFDAYGTDKDIQLQLGSNATIDLTSDDDSNDRTQLISAGASVPNNCYLKNANDNGVLLVDITGNAGTGEPNLTSLPGSTGEGTPNNSYGFFRFIVKVKP